MGLEMANIGQSTQGTYVNGANHGRVQQDWVGEGSSKEAFTQGFGMFDAEQDTHNCDFGNTHRISRKPKRGGMTTYRSNVATPTCSPSNSLLRATAGYAAEGSAISRLRVLQLRVLVESCFRTPCFIIQQCF